MARSQYSSNFFADAEKRLDSLADAGEYLRVLDLLRKMEQSILKCHQAKVPVQRIWMELTDLGAVFTRQHFTRAYRMFMDEKQLKPQPWNSPRRRPDLPPQSLPPERKLPPSRAISQAVKALKTEGNEATSSLDLITKDL